MDYDSRISTDPSDNPEKDAAWERYCELHRENLLSEVLSLYRSYEREARNEYERIYGTTDGCDWEPET